MDNYTLIVCNIAWGTKWMGTFVIVLCWFQIIPLKLGWIGFGVALISFLVETMCKKKLMPPETESNPEG